AAANCIAVEPGAVDWLFEHHYRNAGRSPRFCHPRDLLHQVKTLCTFRDMPAEANQQVLSIAAKNYFGLD
ncbi:MAG: hypothetical protein MI757_18930, partial [Pirellulales bacterium]|nr:hypothetical protein [Pirellulales bacterium]